MIRTVSVLLLFTLFVSCRQTATKSADKQQQAKNSLTAALDSLYRQGYFNGFSVALVNENGTLYQNGFGYAAVENKRKYTVHTIQNIASISKTFVGIALLKAQELHALKLDDPINKYLPFKVYNPHFPDQEITIRHLATHTSGIMDNDYYLTQNYYLKPGQDLKNVKQTFDDTQVFNAPDSVLPLNIFLSNFLAKDGKWNNSFSKNKPGAIYEYSNIATTLAAYIVELATGEGFDSFTTRHILKPLQMNESGWKFDAVDFSKYSRLYENPKTLLPYYAMISYPDGNFITSINDLSKYLTELIKGFDNKGTILNKNSYSELFRGQLSARNFTERNTQNPYSESYNVGILMGISHTGNIGHTGGDPGVASMLFFNPKTKIGRIIITNTSITDKPGSDMFYRIWDELEARQNSFIE